MEKKISRGLKNHNPGNIRISKTKYKGELVPSTDKAFKEFVSIKWGYRAMFVLLYTYQKKWGLETIGQMIDRYAPPNENATKAYASFVARRAGVEVDRRIDLFEKSEMMDIVGAMSLIENGVEPVMSEVEKGWELFEKHRP